MDAQDSQASVTSPRPLSVAFISSYGGLGGSELYLERLLAQIDRSITGRVVLLGEGPLQDRLRPLGYAVNLIPTAGSAWSMLASSWQLRRRLRSDPPDVVHANGLKATLVATLATAGTTLPVIWVRHDFSYEGWRARALARMCRRVICVSNSLAITFRGGLMRKVTVIHTGMPLVEVDREKAHRLAREVIADPDARPIISLVGQLVPGKGHRDLIDISADLVAQLPRARIAIIGGLPSPRFAPYLEELEARVDARGVGEVVRFLGHRDDAISLVAGSDVVVMPSVSVYEGHETEGFPLLALEALAVGTPIAAYRVGGLPEAVGGCGSIVKPGDRKGLMEAIIRVTTDPVLWDQQSQCGRSRVRSRFSMAAMLEGLQLAYRRAARG